MAKRKRKAQITQSRWQRGHMVEEIFDDSLLPDASEIKKTF